MKKCILMALVMVFCLNMTISFADESFDFSHYSDEELVSMRDAINNELGQRRKNESPESPDSPTSDFLYVSNGTEIRINAYLGQGGTVVIPDEIDDCNVTQLADKAFYDTKDIISGIVLPEHLTTIGDSFMSYARNLTGVLVLPKSTEYVGSHSFQAASLTGIIIQSDCQIRLNSFCNNSSLEFVYIKDGCSPSIDQSVFSYNDNLKIVIIPPTVTTIKDETFKGCNYLKIITTPGSYAEEYARRNFIPCETETYEQYVSEYSSLY